MGMVCPGKQVEKLCGFRMHVTAVYMVLILEPFEIQFNVFGVFVLVVFFPSIFAFLFIIPFGFGYSFSIRETMFNDSIVLIGCI